MRSAAAATALGITLSIVGLSSCAEAHDPVAPSTPEPGVTPVFASDEEALAAAEEVYGRYLDVVNRIGQSGWTDTEALSDVTRDRALTDELANAEEFSSKHYRQVGESTFDSLALQQVLDHGPSSVVLTFYVCIDVTDVDVLDATGKSVVPDSRPERQALEVEADDVDGVLKLNRSEAWSGSSFC